MTPADRHKKLVELDEYILKRSRQYEAAKREYDRRGEELVSLRAQRNILNREHKHPRVAPETPIRLVSVILSEVHSEGFLCATLLGEDAFDIADALFRYLPDWDPETPNGAHLCLDYDAGGEKYKMEILLAGRIK